MLRDECVYIKLYISCDVPKHILRTFFPVRLTKIFRGYISRCRFVNKAQSGSSDESMLARHESLSVPKVRASLSVPFLFFVLLYVVQCVIIVKYVAMKIDFIFMNLSLDKFHLINN